jgi:WD40 repeat protein
MNSCITPEQFQRFVAEQLSEAERRTMETHLSECIPCQQALERLSQGDPILDLLIPLAGQIAEHAEPLEPFLRELQDNPPPEVERSTEPGDNRQPTEFHFLDPPTERGLLGRIDSYHIEELLGCGGFGFVFKAYYEELRCHVALKVLKPEQAASASDRDQFLGDAQKARAVRDDHVVTIHNVGNTRALHLPYFVMEYLDGGSLSDRLKQQGPLKPQETAEFVRQAALGLAAVHARGLIHRDIKPSNIMLEKGSGRAKITDFGLARWDEVSAETLTQSGGIVGTLPYISPELVRSSSKIDKRSDVYSLGVVLYELLTGERPFRGQPHMILQQVVHDEPRAPRRLNDAIPYDLETIALVCLAKEPIRRYQSAGEVAADIQRWQERKPIKGRRTGAAERLWLWCRRKPGLAMAAGLAAMFLIATTAIAVGWAVHASRLAGAVQTALAENHLDRGLTEGERGDVGLGMLWMVRGLETVPSGANKLAQTTRTNLAGWRQQLFALTDCQTLPGKVLGFCPDGHSVWTVEGKTVSLWDLNRGQFVGHRLAHPGPVTILAVSPDGKMVATGCSDGTVRLWDAATGQVRRELPGGNTVCALAFIPHDCTVLVGRLKGKGPQENTSFQLWETATGQQLGQAFHQSGPVTGVALSPDGRTLLTIPHLGKTVSRWEMPTGGPLGAMVPQPGVINAVAYSPDGRFILTGGEDRAARLWDAASGGLLAVLHHREPVWAVAFGLDGRTLLTASPGDAIRVWQGAASPEPLQKLHLTGPVRALAVSPDGTRVVTGSDDRVVRLWKVVGERLSLERELWHPSPLASASFSPNGELLATSTYQNNAALLWEVTTGRRIAELPHTRPVWRMVFSPNSKRVATASTDWTAQLWDTTSGQPVIYQPLRHNRAVVALAFSPDGRMVMTGSEDGTAQLWNAATGLPHGPPLRHDLTVLAVSFSPDGRLVLTGSEDGTAQLWDAATGAPRGPALEHGYAVWAVAFSPDDRTILTGSLDHTARFWDIATYEPRGPPLRHAGPIWSVAFSPDGRWVVTASDDATARMWDVGTGRALGPPLPHGEVVYHAAIAPDKRWVVTAGKDGIVRLWPTPAPLEAAVPDVVLWAQVLTGMELDSAGGVQVLDAAIWHQRRQRLQDLNNSLLP